MTTGRRPAAVETSTRFRLVDVKPGSVIAVLELPDVAQVGQPSLEIDDRQLNDLALEHTLRTLEGSEEDPRMATTVAEALLQLAEDVAIGVRYQALEIEAPRAIRPRRRRVRLDNRARDRLRSTATIIPPKPGTVAGVLVEADFEKLSAHVRAPSGQRVFVSFPSELADAIQAALRDRAELQGLVTYDPKSAVALQVELRSLLRGRQLTLGLEAEAFWRTPSVEDLALEMGVGPVSDPYSLQLADLSASEADAFLESLKE